jgi:hypothetical protein
MLRNSFLFAVTSNHFVTIKISLTSDCWNRYNEKWVTDYK